MKITTESRIVPNDWEQENGYTDLEEPRWWRLILRVIAEDCDGNRKYHDLEHIVDPGCGNTKEELENFLAGELSFASLGEYIPDTPPHPFCSPL